MLTNCSNSHHNPLMQLFLMRAQEDQNMVVSLKLGLKLHPQVMVPQRGLLKVYPLQIHWDDF